MRLIDADALIVAFDKRLITALIQSKTRRSGKILHYGISVGMNFARNVTNEQPTVDAVEVVRCKDCRFWVHEFDNVGHCTYAGIHLDHAGYGFCSYGERRDENA